MMAKIRSEADFIFAVAAALEEGDENLVREIRREVSDWLESDTLRAARVLLLDTVEGKILEAQS